jgi:RNA polymerase subunit RPABC4/transcription elongation factor Spt4
MAFWEDFSETISTKGKEMADKAKNFTDIASLRGQIVSYENTILRYYREIGRAYYEAHKNDLTKEFPEQMDAIAKSENMIKELEKRISQLRGTQKCAACGNEVPDDSIFCPKCGSKMEDETFFDEEDSVVTDTVVTEVVDDIIDEE